MSYMSHILYNIDIIYLYSYYINIYIGSIYMCVFAFMCLSVCKSYIMIYRVNLFYLL